MNQELTDADVGIETELSDADVGIETELSDADVGIAPATYEGPSGLGAVTFGGAAPRPAPVEPAFKAPPYEGPPPFFPSDAEIKAPDDSLLPRAGERSTTFGGTKGLERLPTADELRQGFTDPLLSLAKGAIGIPEAYVGLADIPTLGWAGKLAAAGGFGFQPKVAKEFLTGLQSEELQQAQKNVSEAKGFWGTVKAMLQNPSAILDTGLESVPSMLSGAGVGKKIVGGIAKKLAPQTAAVVGGAVGEGLITSGQNAEQLRQESKTGLLTPKQSALAASSGAATTLISVFGGRLAQRLGIDDIDTLFAGGKSVGAKTAVIKRVIGGVISEGALEELPQSWLEQIHQNIASGKPWDQGIAEAAAQGFVVGAAMGGTVSGIAPSLGVQAPSDRTAQQEIDDLMAKNQPPIDAESGLRQAVAPEGETLIDQAINQGKKKPVAPVVQNMPVRPTGLITESAMLKMSQAEQAALGHPNGIEYGATLDATAIPDLQAKYDQAGKDSMTAIRAMMAMEKPEFKAGKTTEELAALVAQNQADQLAAGGRHNFFGGALMGASRGKWANSGQNYADWVKMRIAQGKPVPSEAPPVVPPVVPPAAKTDFKSAETGQPFRMRLLRGQGTTVNPYGEGVPQEPILGKGRWTTQSREYAETFGKNITEHDVDLKNPLVIRTDDEWRSLTNEAGWKYANPFGQDLDVTKKNIRDIRALIESKGHDGVVIDPSESGDAAKTLWNVFGAQQVVEFNPTSEAGGQQPIKKPVAPKKRGGFYIRPRADGVTDILDAIQYLGGIAPPGKNAGGEYDGYAESRRGLARLLFTKNAYHRPDTIIAELHSLDSVGNEAGRSWQKIQTTEDLWAAIRAATADRAKLKSAGGGPDAQADRFWYHSDPDNKKGLIAKNVQDLSVGDKFKLKGSSEELTVTHIDPDTFDVTIKGDRIYGTQTIPDGAKIWVREKSFKTEGEADWNPEGEQVPSADEYDRLQREIAAAIKNPLFREQTKAGSDFRDAFRDLEDQAEFHKPAAIAKAQAEIDAEKKRNAPPPPAEPPVAPPAEPPPPAPKPFLKPSEQAEVDALIAEMKKMLGLKPPGMADPGASPKFSGVPIDPALFDKGARLAYIYAKAGVRKFSDFARAMIKTMGDVAKPYLLSWYNNARLQLKEIAHELDSEAESQRIYNQHYAPGATGKPEVPGPVGGGGLAGGRPGIRISRQELIPEPRQHVDVGSYAARSGFRLDEHQVRGINLVLDRFLAAPKGGFVLADGTGFGKTAQMLAIADQYIRTGIGKRVLVISQNKQVIEMRFKGDAAAMGIDPKILTLTTYTGLKNLPKQSWDLVIFDEAHNLKNPDAQKSVAAAKLDTKHTLFGTATPMDRPTGAAYFLAEITGKTEAEIAHDLGYQIVEREDPVTHETYDSAVLLPGFSWPKVWANIMAHRDAAIKAGAMIRREYPFYGEVGLEPMKMDLADKLEHDQLVKHFDKLIEGTRNPTVKRNYSGQKTLQLGRWAEQVKINRAVEMAVEHIKKGGQAIIVAETDKAQSFWQPVRDSHSEMRTSKTTGRTREVWVTDGAITKIKRLLAEQGITDIADIHDPKANDVALQVRKFQSGKARVALATPQSGGTGIDLDDSVGNSPRLMIALSKNMAGDSFEQLVGRVSRKNTKSPSNVKFLDLQGSFGDQRRNQILDKKIKTLKAIQGGEDLDAAGGFSPQEGRAPGEDVVAAEEIDDFTEPAQGAAPGAAPGAAATGQPAGPIIQLTPKSERQIITDLAKVLKLPVRFGPGTHPKYGGYFFPFANLIRSKRANDIPVVTHEGGHKLDDMFKFRTDPLLDAELMNLGDPMVPGSRSSWTKGKSKDYRRGEGVAEFVRYWLTDPANALSMAPKMHQRFLEILDANKDLGDAFRQAQDDIKVWQTATSQARVRAHISTGENPNKTRYTISQLSRDLVDDLHFLKLAVDDAQTFLGRKLDARQNPYVLARLLRGNYGMAGAFVSKGVVDFRTKEVTLGTSYEDALKPVAGRIADFTDFIVAKRAQELLRRGKETGLKPSDTYEVVRKFGNDPVFLKAFDDIKKWQDALLQYTIDAGLVQEGTPRIPATLNTPEIGPTGAYLIREMNQDYVPFHRIYEVGAGEPSSAEAAGVGRGLNVGKPGSLKSIGGSPRDIINPLETMVKNAYVLITAAEKQAVNVAVANLSRVPGMGKWVELDRTPKDMIRVGIEKLRKQLEKAGADLTAVPDNTMLHFFQNSKQARFGENTIRIMRDGKPEFYVLKRELFDTFHALNNEDSGMIIRFMSMPAQLLRAGVTMSPDFALANAIRDTMSAAVISKYGVFPFHVTLKGIATMIGNPKLVAEWAAAGGQMSVEANYFDRAKMQKYLSEKISQDLSPAERALWFAKSPLLALRLLTGISEQATRIGEYKSGFDKLIKQGMPPGDARRMAAYDARDRQDFAKGGAKTKPLRHMAAFWNAALQANVRLAQAFKENPVGTTLKGLTWITLAKLAEQAANWDDEDYWDRPQWQRDLFFLISVGKGADGHTKFIPVPVPFELGVIFATVPGRFLQWYREKNPANLKSVPKLLIGQGVPNPVPQAAQTFFADFGSGARGWDLWRGREIVPQEVAQRLPGDQWTAQTSLTARKVGKMLGFSPMKIDHIIAGTTGGLGKQVVHNVIDPVISKATGEPRTAKGYVPFGRFISTPAAVASQATDEFYTQLNRMRAEKASKVKTLDVSKLKKFEWIAAHVSALNDQIREAKTEAAKAHLYEMKLRLIRRTMKNASGPSSPTANLLPPDVQAAYDLFKK